jgi:integrase
MAWIIERSRKSGKPWLHVQWRDVDRKIRSKSLRTTDMRVALMEKARIEAEVEGRDDAPVAVDAGEALILFLEYLATRRRLRAPTVQVYRERLAPLFRDFRHTPLTRWNRRMVGEYLDRHSEWSPRTIQLTVNACKVFIKWCKKDGYVQCPDFIDGDGLVPRVRPKTDHEVYSLSEIAMLMKAVRGEPRRNRWIDLAVNLAFWASLPVGDVCALEWRHIDLKSGTLEKRREKTGELIAVPIAAPLRRVLRRHPGISGLVVPHMPKSLDSARKSLRVKIARAGIRMRPEGQRGFHLLRHSLSTALDRVGTSPSTISLILGHSGGSQTHHYIHSDLERARAAVVRLEDAYECERRELIIDRLEEREARREAS